MNCEQLAALLTDFLEGELSPQDEAAAVDHVSGCQACSTVLGETQQIIEWSHKYASSDLDPSTKQELLARFVSELD